MACFCYLLECSDGSFYTGWTTDPQRRAKQHNLGTGARYTRMHRPVRLVYVRTTAPVLDPTAMGVLILAPGAVELRRWYQLRRASRTNGT
jgi:hypothetical protein